MVWPLSLSVSREGFAGAGVVGGSAEGVTVRAGAAVAVPACPTPDGIGVVAAGEGSPLRDGTGGGDRCGGDALGGTELGAGTGLPVVEMVGVPAALNVAVAPLDALQPASASVVTRSQSFATSL